MKIFINGYITVYLNEGYMCKFCELFPTKSKEAHSKWGEISVVLGSHCTRKLEKHEASEHHKQAAVKYNEALLSYVGSSNKKASSIYQKLMTSINDKEKADKLHDIKSCLKFLTV